MKLSATHAFNCVVLRVKFGQTSYEDIPPALYTKNKESEVSIQTNGTAALNTIIMTRAF